MRTRGTVETTEHGCWRGGCCSRHHRRRVGARRTVGPRGRRSGGLFRVILVAKQAPHLRTNDKKPGVGVLGHRDGGAAGAERARRRRRGHTCGRQRARGAHIADTTASTHTRVRHHRRRGGHRSAPCEDRNRNFNLTGHECPISATVSSTAAAETPRWPWPRGPSA
jgi:hypothetical protein